MVLDFDYKLGAGANSEPAPDVAIAMARDMLERLAERTQIDLGSLNYYISGKKGCHIEIPADAYGGEAGHPELPLIHKYMAMIIQNIAFAPAQTPGILDLQMYCMGRGKLLRLPNIRRPNGRYKVPVSAWEFFNLDYPALERLTMEPRADFDPGANEPVLTPRLAEIYDDAVGSIRAFGNRFNPVSGLEALLDCDFIAHCFNDRKNLPEPHWWAMIRVLATFGEAGRKMIHEFSQDYPGYSFEATEKKINTPQMRQGRGPIGCEYIQSLPFECGKRCGVRSPADLWKRKRSEEAKAAMVFIHRPDGLYRVPENGADEPLKICSPLKTLGKMRNPEGFGWARLVEIVAPDGGKKELCVYMRDMKGRGEGLISLLLDNGLELAQTVPKAQQYLMEYLMNGAPQDLPLLCVQRIGWLEDAYVLPDEIFGGQLKDKVHFQAEGVDSLLHQVAGTLEEWQEHVGGYCRGNSLLELLVSYALTGPLLKLAGLEGGGLHLHGNSSTGKTTCAIVAGSVCGGGGTRGFIRQWRATHNALESVAVLHNDFLLILDEISQASGETVSQMAYMLANGQGKERMRADASRRKTLTWLLNFLSTGELTINDKIQEFGKYTALAGQEVRVIDLPIDGLGAENTFQNLHGLPDSGGFSEFLGENARRYYGRPIRAFLAALCANLEANAARIIKEMEAFVAEGCPPDASGQVRRICRKFGLIAAAGELAIAFGVLPFEPGASKKAAADWFNIWLSRRDGLGNLEMIKAIARIKDHLALYSDSARFKNLDSPGSYAPPQIDGFIWKVGEQKRVLMLASVFNALAKSANRRPLVEELDRLGYLAHNKNGRLMETKSVNGDSKRGLVFIPSAWGGEPDPAEAEEELQRASQALDELFK